MRILWLVLLLMAPTTTQAAPVLHDVLVLFTTEAVAQYGEAQLRSKIANAFVISNGVHAASETNIELVALAVIPSPVPQTASNTCDQWRLMQDDLKIRETRDAYGADIVMMVVNLPGGACGGLWYWFSGSTITRLESHLAVPARDLHDYTTIHEFGHAEAGLQHDRQQYVTDSGGTPYPSGQYAIGYKNCTAGAAVRTVMSYPCRNGVTAARIGRFSDPFAIAEGQPIGVDPAVDPANAAYAVRALKEFAPKLAAYRTRKVAPAARPMPPSGFRAE